MADRLLFDRDTGTGFRLAIREAGGTVTTIGPSGDDRWFSQPNVAGTRLAFVTSPAGTHDPPPHTTSDLWTADGDGTNAAVLVDISAQAPAWTWLSTPHWSPGGQLVVCRNTSGTAVRPTVLDATTGAIVADLDFDAGASLTDAAFHPDPDAGGAGIERVIYCRQGSLVYRDWDGAAPVGARTTLFDRTTWDTGDPGTVNPWCYDPVYSPDGTKVFFLAEFAGQGNGDWGIGACDADGTNPYRVTPDDHIYSKPELSADGTQCYTHRFNGNWEIVEVPSDGTAVATPGLVVVLIDNGDYNEFAVPVVEPPPPNEPPVAVDQAISVLEDVAEGFTLDASDPDLDALTYVRDTEPAFGDLTGTEPNLTYTPDLGYVGPDSFTWHANDGTDDSNVATVTFDVVAFPDAPDCTLYEDSFDGRTGVLIGSDTDGAGDADPETWQEIPDPGPFTVDADVAAGVVTVARPVEAAVGGGGSLPVAVEDVEVSVVVPVDILGGDAVVLFARAVGTVRVVAEFRANSVLVVKIADDPVGPVSAGFAVDPGDVLKLRCVGDFCGALVNNAVVVYLSDPDPTDGLAGFAIDSHADVDDPTPVSEANVSVVCVAVPPPGPTDEGVDEPRRVFAPLSPCGEPPRIVQPSGPLGPLSPCAETRVGVWRRGQQTPVVWFDSALRQIDSYEWGRARTTTTTAKVTVPLTGTVDSACCTFLADLEPWAYELRIFRDMAEVWRGPVVTTRETSAGIVVDARDVTAWAERRVVRSRHVFEELDAARAWARVWVDALRGAWPDGLHLVVSDACADVTRTIEHLPYGYAARPLAEIADGAVDWCAIAGTLLVGGVCTNVVLDVTLYDDAFTGAVEVAKDGLAYAERVYVNGESDVVADAGDPAGLVEMVFDDQGARDVQTARVHAAQEWAVRGRDGVPRIVSMASDVALSPRAPVAINDLVPGRMMRIAVKPGCTEVSTLMRLVALSVTGDADGERIVPAFEPLGTVGGRNV